MGDTTATEQCALVEAGNGSDRQPQLAGGSPPNAHSSSTTEEGNCYCKILVSNHLAGIIIGQAGHEIRTLKNITGAKIVLSPHGMYFPGTTERIAAVEGPEQAVFQVLDWVLDKMSADSASQQSSDSPNPNPPEPQLQPHQNLQQELAAPVWSPRSTAVRICVPRAVVGSLIGKSGGYIQSLRVATGASINISPLFVTAEEACAERIVSVESRKRQSLKTAAFTLIRKINAHPERASCRHVCYFRKHSFESPLAEPLAAARPMRQQQQQLHQLHQQMQPHQQQRDTEALRRRTVSLVMSTRRPASLMELKDVLLEGQRLSSSNNNGTSFGTSAAEEHFDAAFKRFCEARGTAKPSVDEDPATPAAQPAAAVRIQATAEPVASAGSSAAAAAESKETMLPPLTSSMREVAQQARTEKTASVAAAAAVARKGTDAGSWDFSACSTAAGSTDKLPSVTEECSGNNTISGEHNLTTRQLQQQPNIALLVLIAVVLVALLRLVMQS